MIFAHTCPHCGYTWTPMVIQVASVLNISCYDCQAHIRYGNVDDLPILDDILQAVWVASECDLALIDAAKKAIIWPGDQVNASAPVKYLRLFNAVLFCKKVKKDLARITPRITFV